VGEGVEPMIVGALWLLGCQLAGELVVRALHVPVPGPVVGMVLLFAVLRLGRADGRHGAVRAGDVLLRHLQLLFVPAGTGVVVYLGTIGDHALPIVVGMVVSWALGLAVVGWMATLVERRGRR
jgi:holin-like protein